MKIPFKPLKKSREKPLVTVTLRNPKKRRMVRSLALVDSGSDSCFFDAELAALIGLDVLSGKKGTIIGVVPDKYVTQYIHTVEMEYDGKVFPVEVGFIQCLSKHGYGILGQNGFFDQVESVTFERKKNVFEIIV